MWKRVTTHTPSPPSTAVPTELNEAPTIWEQDGPPVKESPFVGRARELATLYELLGQVENGQGKVVCIDGAPGVGKSRLLHEFYRGLQRRQVMYLSTRCCEVEDHIALFPIRQLIRQCCHIVATDDVEAIQTKVRQRLIEVEMESEIEALFLLRLLGAETTTAPLVSLSPDAVHTKTVACFRQLLTRSSRYRPMIIAIEDSHALDTASQVYMASLAGSLASVPMMLVFTQRSGPQRGWISASLDVHMSLSPLTPQQGLRILKSILPSERVSQGLEADILNKAAGNPLFIEEASYAATESDTAQWHVPETLSGVVSVRLERLPDAPKRLLQMAAALRRSAPLQLVQDVWEGPEDFYTTLLELQQCGLCAVYRDGDALRCHVTHTVARRIIYDAMPEGQRQKSHAALGRALEHHDGGYRDEVADGIAYHYARAGQLDRAIAALGCLAEQATKYASHAEASQALRKALLLISQLPATPERERLDVDLHLQLSKSLAARGLHTESLELLLPLQTRLATWRDPARTGHWALLLTYAYYNLREWASVAQYAQRAIHAATSARDGEVMGQAYLALAMERYWAEDIPKGMEDSNQAIELLAASPERYRYGFAHFILALHAFTHGDFTVALQSASEAQRVGDAIGDVQLQTSATWLTGWIEATRGNVDAYALSAGWTNRRFTQCRWPKEAWRSIRARRSRAGVFATRSS